MAPLGRPSQTLRPCPWRKEACLVRLFNFSCSCYGRARKWRHASLDQGLARRARCLGGLPRRWRHASKCRRRCPLRWCRRRASGFVYGPSTHTAFPLRLVQDKDEQDCKVQLAHDQVYTSAVALYNHAVATRGRLASCPEKRRATQSSKALRTAKTFWNSPNATTRYYNKQNVTLQCDGITSWPWCRVPWEKPTTAVTEIIAAKSCQILSPCAFTTSSNPWPWQLNATILYIIHWLAS